MNEPSGTALSLVNDPQTRSNQVISDVINARIIVAVSLDKIMATVYKLGR